MLPPPNRWAPHAGLWPAACLTFGLILTSGCGGDGSTEPPPSAAQLALVTQPPPQAQSRVSLAAQPVVQLQDAQGGAVAQANVPVTASMATGGGSLTGTTTVNTSSNGRAAFTDLALAGTVGQRTLIFASPNLSSVTSTTIDLSAGIAASVAVSEGDQQTAPAGRAVTTPVSVTVSDADNNRVSGVPITFQVTAGGGTVDPSTPISTDVNGVAAVTSWVLGTVPGTNTLSATAEGIGAAAVFTATGLVAATIRGNVTVSREPLAGSARTPATSARFTGPRSGKFKPLAVIHSVRRRLTDYTPDELIVTYRAGAVGAPPRGASALVLRSTAKAVGGEIRARMARHLSAQGSVTGVSPAVLTARIRVPNPSAIDHVAAELRRDPAVATVERNVVLRRDGALVPTRSSNDPFGPYQAWHYRMIDLPEAWHLTTGSTGVLVAVIDDGIRFDHPDIAPNLTSDGYDFVSKFDPLPICSGGSIEPSGDGDGYDPDPTMPASYFFDGECFNGPEDIGNHGLHTAGTIGAVGDNGIGLSGVNWTVRIRPVRAMAIDGSGTGYDIAQGVLYAAGLPADDGAGGLVQADIGARIVNMSLGGGRSKVVQEAVIAATDAGALIIASAGNNANSAPQYPAAYPEVVSVSAVEPNGELASYSSFGPTVDIAAPGGGGDGFPVDPSFGVASTFWNFAAGAPIYAAAIGTSMAAPHASGVAALLLAQDPGLSAAELRSRLIDYAVDAGSPGRDNRYGAGILNARNSLTQNFGPPRQLHARLYDALTGAVVQSVAASTDGSYSFAVTEGSYQVFAGQDESGDQMIGLPGRGWGAFGGAATPSRIDVEGVGTRQASFRIGFPSEQEPNGRDRNFDGANALPLGSYLSGATPPENDDNFRVLIPQAGQYTFETFAVDGACGFALEEDTTIELYHVDGTLVDANDDIDPNLNFCSRLSIPLQPGSYYLRVQGYQGGRYQVQARVAP